MSFSSTFLLAKYTWWWHLNLNLFEKTKLYMQVQCCCMSDSARLGNTVTLTGPWIGYIHGGNTGLFYYQMNSSIISQAARQQGTKIRIPSLLFVHCNKHLFVLLRNTCILSCQELFNVGHVEQDNQMMPGSPIWRKWGPKLLLAQGATIPVMLWSSGHSMTVTQQNYQLSLCWNNH